MSTPAPGTTQSTGNVLSIIAIVCGAVSVIILPIVFGPIGIVLAVIAKTSRKESLANIALIVAVAGMVVGFILGAIVFSTNN